jgi:hypothetical protein
MHDSVGKILSERLKRSRTADYHACTAIISVLSKLNIRSLTLFNQIWHYCTSIKTQLFQFISIQLCNAIFPHTRGGILTNEPEVIAFSYYKFYTSADCT